MKYHYYATVNMFTNENTFQMSSHHRPVWDQNGAQHSALNGACKNNDSPASKIQVQ